MSSIDGLISGLDTTSIISSLMTIERRSGTSLTQGRTRSQTMVSVLQSLNTTLSTLRTAARAFAPDSVTQTSAWASTTTTSSRPGLATASAAADAAPGRATFTVTSVATAGAAVSRGSVASLTTPVVGGPVLLATGLAPLGVSSLSGAGLSSGTHSLEVTQASAGASVAGAALAATTTVDAASAGLTVDLGAGPVTIQLTQGTYTREALAAEVTRASGGTLAASVDADGALRLVTTREGAAAGLRVAAANAALGLTDTTTTAAGTDGVVTLDGVATTVGDLSAGSTVTVPGTGGNEVVLTLGGGLRTGTARVADLGLSSGATLAEVVAAVGGSDLGVRANAVRVGPDAYRLQLTSSTTGASSDVTLGAGAFTAGGLGGVVELERGTDTVLRVGSGPGAFDVRSSTSTVSGLLDGVTITALAADPTTPVTVSVTGDDAAVADRMAELVAAANATLSFVSARAGYDADTKTAGLLLGDSMSQALVRRIGDVATGSAASQPSAAGIQLGRDGQLAFDRDAFLAAWAKDPTAVRATLTTMASSLADVAASASDPVDGYVTSQITTEKGRIRDYTQQISSFEARMALREETLKRQYATLESTLGRLKSQSDWLAGQLATLTTPKSSS